MVFYFLMVFQVTVMVEEENTSGEENIVPVESSCTSLDGCNEFVVVSKFCPTDCLKERKGALVSTTNPLWQFSQFNFSEWGVLWSIISVGTVGTVDAAIITGWIETESELFDPIFASLGSSFPFRNVIGHGQSQVKSKRRKDLMKLFERTNGRGHTRRTGQVATLRESLSESDSRQERAPPLEQRTFRLELELKAN